MQGTDSGPIDAAFDRLDAMLARLEEAATRPNSAAQELQDLKIAHQALKAKVGNALSDLDGLLEDFGAHG